MFAIRMPYRTSSADSLNDAQLVIEALGINAQTIDISAAVDGYLSAVPAVDARPQRQRHGPHAHAHALRPVGEIRRIAGRDRKQNRTAHGLLSPGTPTTRRRSIRSAICLKRRSGHWRAISTFRSAIIDKPPSADLEANQTDETDLGITYVLADRILNLILAGYRNAAIVERGFAEPDVELVRKRVDGTHWKRHLPTTALVSGTAINEFYLRPVDY